MTEATRARALGALSAGEAPRVVAAECGIDVRQARRLLRGLKKAPRASTLAGDVISTYTKPDRPPSKRLLAAQAHATQEKQRRLATAKRVNAILRAAGIDPTKRPIVTPRWLRGTSEWFWLLKKASKHPRPREEKVRTLDDPEPPTQD